MLRVGDVPSKGLSSRPLPGWKTQRIHHFLSALEENYFYTLEWAVEVVDIREQFPLPLEATVAIAEQHGIAHPPKNKAPEVMTSDFLITIRNDDKLVDQVRTIKPAKDLASKRTLEKLELERRYWKAQNIDWRIVTENEISRPLAENVKWVHPFRNLRDHPGLTEKAVQRIEQVLAQEVRGGTLPLSTIATKCDDLLGQPPGASLTVVRHLLATRRWTTDMSIPIDPSKPVPLAPTQPITSEEHHGVIYQLASGMA